MNNICQQRMEGQMETTVKTTMYQYLDTQKTPWIDVSFIANKLMTPKNPHDSRCHFVAYKAYEIGSAHYIVDD